jgi:hypothetical protein
MNQPSIFGPTLLVGLYLVPTPANFAHLVERGKLRVVLRHLTVQL